MPDRDHSIFLRDIIEAIGKIERYTEGMTYEDFIRNEMAVDAVIRNFEGIGEAAAHIPGDIRMSHAAVPPIELAAAFARNARRRIDERFAAVFDNEDVLNYAIAQQTTGKLDVAEENLKKALAIDPDHPVANNEYGILYRRTGRFAEARKTYERILNKYPAFIPARKNLAILCDSYMNDFDCALKNYQMIGDASPGDKAVQIWITDVKTRSGR